MTELKFLQVIQHPDYAVSRYMQLSNQIWVWECGDGTAVGDDKCTYVLCGQGWLEMHEAMRAGLWNP